MSEPQPQDATDVEPNAAPSASAEDRKAAAALSALDARGDDADAAATANKPEVDTAALGEAMSRLEMLDKKTATSKTQSTKEGGEGDAKKEPAKKIKVDPQDVSLLTEYLELSKVKATELLRQHDGQLEGALEAWITAGRKEDEENMGLRS